MRKEYELGKLRKREGPARASADAAKVQVSLRIDGGVLAALKEESARRGLPYQTLIGSILHQYVGGDLVEARTVEMLRKLQAG